MDGNLLPEYHHIHVCHCPFHWVIIFLESSNLQIYQQRISSISDGSQGKKLYAPIACLCNTV